MAAALGIVSLCVAVASFIVAFVVCFTNLWRQYQEKEWQKAYREVELAQLYPKAQNAQAQVHALRKLIREAGLTIEKVRLSEPAKASDCQREAGARTESTGAQGLECQLSARHLDYAELHFLWKSESLDGSCKIGDKTLKQVCDELEACRQEAQAFWDSAAGQYKAHQLLHTPKWPRLRGLLGLPTEGFLSPKWAGRGARHNSLIQPLDIANWCSLDEEAPYKDAQPPRYIVFPPAADKGKAVPQESKAARYQRAKEEFL